MENSICMLSNQPSKIRALLFACVAIGTLIAALGAAGYLQFPSWIPERLRPTLRIGSALSFLLAPLVLAVAAGFSIPRTKSKPSDTPGNLISGFGLVLLLITVCSFVTAPFFEGGIAGPAGFMSTIFLMFAGLPGLVMVGLASGRRWEQRQRSIRRGAQPPVARRFSGSEIIGSGLVMLLLAGWFEWYGGKAATIVSVDVGLPGVVLVLIGWRRAKRRG